MGLLVCLALASAMLFLPVFNIVAFEQMLYFAGEVLAESRSPDLSLNAEGAWSFSSQ